MFVVFTKNVLFERRRQMNERQRYESAECRNYVIISHLTTTILRRDKFSWKQQIKFVRNPLWPSMKLVPILGRCGL